MAKNVRSWGFALAALLCSFEAKAMEVECIMSSPHPHEIGDSLGHCIMEWGFVDRLLYTYGLFGTAFYATSYFVEDSMTEHGPFELEELDFVIMSVRTFEDSLNEWWFEYNEYNDIEIEGAGGVWGNLFDDLESDAVSELIYVAAPE